MKIMYIIILDFKKGAIQMTVGEKIQLFRKEQKLSQEDLAGKLMVSRQTISLWEKDQTLPTIDNLIRLKEIFQVPIDNILCSDSFVTNTSKEIYSFTYSKKEMSRIYRIINLKNMIITCCAYVLVLMFFIANEAPDILTGTFLGFLIYYTIISVKFYIQIIKSYKQNIQKQYVFEVIGEQLLVSIRKGTNESSKFSIPFSDISKSWETKDLYIFIYSRNIFCIKKVELSQNSRIPAIFSNKTCHQHHNYSTLKTVSLVLFIASILSIFGALICTGILSGINNLFTENMWVFFLFLPIPIASIVSGILSNKKGIRNKKNIVVGIIMAAFLVLYGSFTFIFSGMYDHSPVYVQTVEERLGIEIPDAKQINTQDWTQGTQSKRDTYLYYTSDVFFSIENGTLFEAEIANDDMWLQSLPNILEGIMPDIYTYEKSNYYYLIYNLDLQEFNSCPTESGNYHFICMKYDTIHNKVSIAEYDIDYVKL